MKPLLLAALLLASTAGAQTQKWEYAQLKIYNRYDGAALFDISKLTLANYYWYDAKGTQKYAIGDKDVKIAFNEFAQKITGVINKTSEVNIEFQNLLGSQGWELVSYTVDDYKLVSVDYAKVETYFYKRSLR